MIKNLTDPNYDRLESLDSVILKRKYWESYTLLSDVFLSYNPARLLYNLSPARILFGPIEYQWTVLPVNMGDTLRLLCDVHGYELFQCGIFNGDCHPGMSVAVVIV